MWLRKTDAPRTAKLHLSAADNLVLPDSTTMRTLQQQPTNERIRATVFDIPLLIDLIARHLTTHDVYICTLVSHQFHDAFQHCLYPCISIAHKVTFEKFIRTEAVSAFLNHLSYVREVSTPMAACIMHLANIQHSQTSALPSTSVFFKNLTVFRHLRSFFQASTLDMCSVSILSLLEASPALRVLHLTDFAYHSDPLILHLAKIIREKGHRLKELRLKNVRYIPRTHLFTLVWSCAAVEELCVDMRPEFCESIAYSADTFSGLRALAREALSSKGTGSDGSKPEAVDLAKFPQDTDRIEFAWKELSSGGWLIDSSLEMIVELFQRCPSVERATVPRLAEQDVIKHLAPIMAKTMPQLRHLNLKFINDQPLGTCSLVQSCKNLVSLKMERLRFDPQALVDAVVLGHGHSLQELHIESANRLTSQQLNLILSNCPRLISFCALEMKFSVSHTSPTLNTKDMAMVPKKPGWSCKNLETLQLDYESADMSIRIPEVLWRQIGQLSKLKELSLFRCSWVADGVQEQESVMQAVSSWKVLSDLSHLELRSLNAFLDERLVNQAKDQWAKLGGIQYTYH